MENVHVNVNEVGAARVPTPTDPRVFLVEPTRKNINIETAEQFGRIKHLFEPGDRRASLFNADKYIEDVAHALRRNRFAPEDSFCIAGSMLAVTLAVIALFRHVEAWQLADGEERKVRLLLFNSMDSRYEERFVTASNKAVIMGKLVGDALLESADDAQ